MDDSKIIFQDENLLLINKPAGITVNKADTTVGEQTIQDWVEEKYKINNTNLKSEGENDFYKRGGIVHRLDKETSGVLIITKNEDSFIHLQKQFKDRIVKKTYLALVHGKIIPESGEINVPVGRLPWNRKRFGVIAGGRESVTNYKTIKILHFLGNSEVFTLVELYPETGRTHQIRVHLKHINHPIFSDFLYAGRKTAREDRKLLNRVFLHASKISFLHPVTLKELFFSAPLPEELEKCLAKTDMIT